QRAMDIWRERDPARVHLQAYEALLREPETAIRGLLSACDLVFDPACLRFHEAHRSVRTASAAQVRQPLQAATGRVDGYGELLAPLRIALARAGLAPSTDA